MTHDDRMLDLLAARATEGLDAPATAELERLLGSASEWSADEFELVAAAAHIGALRAEPAEPMPAELRRRVMADAERIVPTLARSGEARGAAGSADVVAFEPGRRERRGFDVRGMGWYAAAAMLVLAIWAPWSTRTSVVGIESSPPGAAESRAALIASADDVVSADWSGAESDYAAVRGDVVWSTARQAGFMRLKGLPANRPTERQYQLWIVDPSRDAEPVDGGVFDVPAGVDEIVVPIDPKLAVNRPTVFAITLEQPGGVVVSEGPLLVVASLG